MKCRRSVAALTCSLAWAAACGTEDSAPLTPALVPAVPTEPTEPVLPAGWDDPPGSGDTFVLSGAEETEPLGLPFGLYSNQRGPEWWSTISYGHRHGIELAGLEARDAHDGYFTLKIYALRDADGVERNDFEPLPGETDCCRYELDPSAVVGGQARYRLPARLRGDRVVAEGRADLAFTVFVWPRALHDFTFATLRWDMARPSDGGIRDLGVSGAVAARDLFTIVDTCTGCGPAEPLAPNPPRPTSALDRTYRTRGAPQVDLDGDGLECLEDTNGDGYFDGCRDGAPAACGGPLVAAEPRYECAAQVDDGYIAAGIFVAVRAQF